MSLSFETKSESELIQILTSAFLSCSLPDALKRKQGEQTLSALGNTRPYPLLLLNLILTQNNFDIALRSSIELKKWCDKYDKMQEYDTNCLLDVVDNVKPNLFQALLSVNYKIALQVSEAVYLLSRKEFPERWKGLAKTLASFLKGDAEMYEKELVCLKTLLKIFKKYEYSERSDPLYEEIILVCNDTHDVFLIYVQLLINKLYAAQVKSKENGENLKLLKTCLKIFYCLNFQDLHPSFENNLNVWMNLLAQVLKLGKEKNIFDDEVLLFKCKGEAMRSILLYATKYREEFEGLITEFSQEIWSICSTTNEDNKYDKIILNALKYFKSLILWPSLSEFFSNNLSMLINTLIIPNLKVSKKDQILFKEEPENFIDVYFNNNGELSSRRSVTVDLMKSLSKYFKDPVNQILESSSGGYVQSLQSSPKNLETELTIINLFCDGAAVCFRAKDGVTESNVSSNLISYIFNNLISGYLFQIYQELASKKINFVEDKYNVFHLTYLLRYIFYFRIYLDKTTLIELTKIISFFLKTKNETLVSIIYYTIEALIDIKEGDFKFMTNMKNYFNKDNIQPQITQILENIALRQSDEMNSYLLRVMLVIVKTLADGVANYIQPFAILYQAQMDKLIKGYTFQSSYLVFESVGTLIFHSCQGNQNSLSAIESYIVPHLNNVFNKNMSDLLGFVLQIYALIVQSSPPTLLKEAYSIIYSSILDLKNWVSDNIPIFPAYALYLQTFIAKFPQKIIDTAAELQKILYYLLTNQQETLFFNIVRTIFQIFDWNSVLNSGWFAFTFQSVFNFYKQLKSVQMSNYETSGKNQELSRPGFIKELFIFICECLIKYDAQTFVSQCEQASNGILKPFLQNEIAVLKTAQRRGRERKVLFIGMINLLFFALNSIEIELWALLLAEMVQNISNRRNVRARFRENPQSLVENVILGNNSGFQKLSNLKENKVEITGICDDEEKFFALKFNEFYADPQIKNAINIGNILTVQQQELLLKILQE